MTRKSSTLILSLIVLAVALAPASALADGYESVSGIVGPTESHDDSYSSVSALVGDRSSPSSTQSDGGSLNAIVGSDGVPEPTPQLAQVSGDGDGFSWSDAGVGALIGASLILMTLAAAVVVARHRRTTAESRA